MICPEIGGSIEEYNIFEQIGKGGFANVYRARCQNTNREVAIKKISKNILTKEKIIERVRQEVSIHSRLDHPSILKLYTFFEDDQYVYLVLELCQNGHLLQQIPFHEKEAQEYLTQVVDGVLYLHSQAIMHRDLSLQNLLLDARGRIKIADFGLATQLKKPEDRHTTMCGTPNYISPEVATRSSHGLEADVWSLGCLLFTMLVGKPPFEMRSAKSTLTKVVIGNYEIPDSVSYNARDLINRCLIKNPKERIKLKDVPNHPFFDMPEVKSCNTYGSDSGVYTISTSATTQHTKAPLPAICEDQEHFSYGGHSDSLQNNRKDLKRNVYTDSPPVRLKANPNEHPYQYGGMFGNLKKKFVGLPTLKKNEPVSSIPPTVGYPCNLPKSSLRERDISEERMKEVAYAKESYENPIGIQDRNSCHSCDSGSYESCPSADKYQQENLNKGYSNDYLDCREREHYPLSRCSRNNLKDREQRGRRSISSDGRINSKAENPFDGVRSNSLDRNVYREERYSEREFVNHSSDCRCYICIKYSHNTPNICSCCRSSNHRSWCDRNERSDPRPYHSSNNHSKHSHKSSHSDSGNADILKDIAPVKRIPSPVDNPPKSERILNQNKPLNSLHSDPKPSLKERCSPLLSRRLKATRQESKNAILNILEDGEVCVEFLQMRKSQKRVHDVCRISPDGLRIVLYQPNGSYGTTPADTPPSLPNEGADYIFSYDSLPQKFWKKYIYAARFVKLVKERTPKITYYSDQAQCILMENSPNPDFVAKFFSGEKFLISNGKVQLTQLNGKQISVAEGECSTAFNDSTMSLYQHVVEVKQHCLMLERVLTQMEDTRGFPNFPIIIGKRPPSSNSPVTVSQQRTENKENVSPMSIQSMRVQNEIGQFGPYEGSMASMTSSLSKFRRPLTPNQDINNVPHVQSGSSSSRTSQQKLFLENIGYLFQDHDEMILKFLDGSCLHMNVYHPSEYVYIDCSNNKHSYPINSSSIPFSLRDKLYQFQIALAKLKPATYSNYTILKQQSYSHKNPFVRSTGSSSELPKYLR